MAMAPAIVSGAIPSASPDAARVCHRGDAAAASCSDRAPPHCVNLARDWHCRGKISGWRHCNGGDPVVSCRAMETSTSSYSSSESVDVKKLAGRPKRGRPLPFGATPVEGGVNFSVHSSGAIAVSLCLFTEEDLQKGRVGKEFPLHPVFNRTGDVWHVYLPDVCPNLLYGYRLNGKFSLEEGCCYDLSRILVDPYAKAVVSRGKYGALGPGNSCWPQMAGMVPQLNDEFDWQGDSPPRHKQKDLIVYELHMRGFTQHPSSNVDFPGTYLGALEKLPHLKDLGINAIELMPIHEFNELEYYSYNPVMGDHKMNYWGYSTINFFSPMTRYASSGIQNCGRDAIKEFKTFVREAHKLGIEVFMDVVFNHTAEGNEMGPIISFRGLDNRVYYMTAPKGEFYNYSGCGNTFNCNHPVVRRFIVDCLRYWVLEMHIDGFRFDLASILTRASSLWDKANVFGASEDVDGDCVTTGTPLSEPPLIDMISNDPVLRGVKLIAEAWDSGGLYQVGNFPHWGIWSEWNGQYRDTVRLFIKGTDGLAGAFAQCLCGSPHLYQDGGRKPWHSVNFVTAHDGFTLLDLVSYNSKHNIANGESNNDGETHNNSWNCGEEGELVSVRVRRLRHRQLRNFLVALMVSQGVPMVTMGDEYAHTKGGNNNTYCHDNAINYFRWDKLRTDPTGLFRFSRHLFNFRRQSESLGLGDFPTAERLEWHGVVPETPDWSETSRFVAFSLVDAKKRELYIAFNTSHLPVLVTLPERPGFKWQPVVDSSKPAPYDFLADDIPDLATAYAQYSPLLNAQIYPMISYSSIILVLVPLNED
ncbi:isoamylase 1, chloroplastic [Selaginella moellendorffii]|uniref:isoamylase 1, chloroplastic n=1 Tax=Selaginella moellendorffii TaxID=88036 RepID=UPI000D1C8151|nr:isoamylase 1, chloroplastic [Selaginella moellendorffii]|eukprot:XP_024544840.1 isoamylase 1, chloroplastic [Selaginella moellendorffii]